jgi:hypothetical protein
MKGVRISLSLLTGTMLLAALSLLFAGCSGHRYESPEFHLVSSEGAFEIRDYPQLTLVSTSMQHRGQDGAFMKLFRFIQGRNDRSEKIAMTVPVVMNGSSSGTMSFILPKSVAEHGAPAPSNPDVTLNVVPPARYACYRFGGSSNPAHSEESARKLISWIQTHHFTTRGKPPPWTPGVLRHNEVLIRLQETP